MISSTFYNPYKNEIYFLGEWMWGFQPFWIKSPYLVCLSVNIMVMSSYKTQNCLTALFQSISVYFKN